MPSVSSPHSRSSSVYSQIAPLLAFLLALTTVGCTGGESHNREAIEGEVTLDGAPLEQGAVRFEPQDGNTGTSSGASIAGGHYEISGAQGLAPGTYRVILTAAENSSDSRSADDIMNNPETGGKELIPAKYNRQSEITIEVKAEGPNKFDFAVETK